MNIEDKIKKLRNDKKLTQKQLAIAAGISEISIRKYESGERFPKYETLGKIANALGVSINDLIYKSPEEHTEAIKKANESQNKNTAKISNPILQDALLYNFILSTLEAKNYNSKIDKIVKSLDLDTIEQLAIIVLENTKNYLRSTVNTNINELEESPRDLSFRKNILDSYIENYNDYIPIDIKAITLLESPEK
ncbi:helix-turn-helix domain-containing protein [Clostridium botulinum]|uniref:helix-turn-helix domain-containing protein n=1 Tax=Clostridium botulinum TaxID=1491 RepID=UPI00096D8E4C|nr:helix-turn-helix transcriptional regulator [Clostridium botulinum]NFA91064.1 XRE family transcriptional regulator [Clostridium botulinum]NFB21254.1 XRE family transcriptional regulator [Clostridium botulinum]NFT58411.1 helix-turn-helix transcriptional regulator [Clostridium botulinum]